MAHSSCSSDRSDSTACSSESNLSLSVGYFPCEDTFSYENTISCEDMSPKGPSILVPPIQGTWRTESTGRLLRRRDQIRDDPKQFCKLSITLAWDTDIGSNNSDSIASWDITGSNQWIDKYPEENTQLTLSKLDSLVQKLEKFLEHQKDEEGGDSAFPGSAQEEDFQLFSSPPPDIAQMISQTTGSQRTSTIETSSVSSGQLEEEDAHSSTQALSCVNFRGVFRWLRQQVLASLLRRPHPKEATERPQQLAQKKRLSHRSKRIQPQDALEFRHPLSPDVLTF
ncbi:uncharacterized protein C12orf71 homolog [Neomonachus schauinslandi]|uniref:Uncharacterized protein C12orf71 homolog n=1 Tax=Neomonachus schauinslandi TaxID=29088 RepID=A0A2Y9H3D2_NEOSC|nr:uncharacterized protein C12orf71 homolog [Neomonachus schauinslandi]